MVATHAQPYAARLTRPDGADGTVWLLAKHEHSTRGAEEAAALVRAVRPAKVRTHRLAAAAAAAHDCRSAGFSTACAHRRVSAQRRLRLRN